MINEHTSSPVIGLPKNLRLQYPYEANEVDLTNWTSMVVTLINNKLYVETKDGVFLIKSSISLIRLLTKYSCIFTFCHPGKVDGIFSVFTSEEIVTLTLFGSLEVKDYTIVKKGTFFSIGYTPIFNLISFTKEEYDESKETIDNISRIAQEIINSREVVGVKICKLYSPSGEARDLAIRDDSIKDEIFSVRKMTKVRTSFISTVVNACYGGRMETTGLGSSFQYHYDLVKAHLNIMKDYPGIRDNQLLIDKKFIDSASPLSIYYIIVDIPEFLPYYPLPTRTASGKLFYPCGVVKGWYFKSYLELLQYLKIPFKVLSSFQLLSGGEYLYPYRDYTEKIRIITKVFESFFPKLHTKHFYATIAGSSKSIYRTQGKNLEEVQGTLNIFNPLLYGYILSEQNCRVFKDAIENGAASIKIDSIASSKKLTLSGDYSLKDEGLSLYVTPFLKTLPQNNRMFYKKAIEAYKDKEYICLEVDSWAGIGNNGDSNVYGLTESMISSVPIGHKYTKFLKIKPNYGNRRGEDVGKVGNLIEKWFPSTPESFLSAPELEKQITFMSSLQKYSGGLVD